MTITNFYFAAVDCGTSDLANPENGEVTFGATTLGEVVEYSCIEGYSLSPSGESTRTCTAEAVWSGNPPECNSEYTIIIIYS